jgi:ATP-dependent Clp protease, protease subunit
MLRNGTDFEKFATGHLNLPSTVINQYENHISSQYTGGMVAMTPSIIEERPMNVAVMSVFDRLMMDRIIYMGMPIDDQVANVINAQLLYLESIDKKKDVKMYLSSGGGSVYAGLGIYDTMQAITPDVATYNMGLCASMAFVLMVAGANGKRSALKHSRSMQHQPMGGIAPGTQASDMDITVREINKLKKELYEIISLHTGQDYDKVLSDCERDYWMIAQEAKEYGAIDKVIGASK